MKLPITSQHTVLQISTEALKPFDGLTSTESPAQLPETTLLSPLLVLESPHDASSYIIIDGYKRYLSWIERKAATVTCVVIPSVALTDAGKMRIELNCNRPVPFSEKLQTLKWGKFNCSESDYQEIVRILSVSGKELRDIELLFDASSQLVNAVKKGILDSTLVSELKFFSNEDTTAVLSLFSRFPFTRQTQRELLEWLPELVYKNKKTISELFESDSVKKIIDDKKLNDPQKIKKIRDYYNELRFPTLADTKKAWNALASSVNPAPSSVTFIPSDAFEKSTLEIKIRITDVPEGLKILKRLSEISERDLESLIYPVLLFNAKNEKKM
ncbi:MAG: hypothetical protein JW915_04570 [Chitinispirillaceae bacterium]|nr:hypothetical protein [Chitinispirillaceae bacterium]